MTQVFRIVGIPKAQGRPRFVRMGSFVKTYDPKESRAYKENVMAQIVAQNPHYVDSGGLSVTFRFSMPVPKTLPKRDMIDGWHCKKPDLDNLIKACLDAMKGIVWRDDSQLCEIIARKTYATAEPGVDIVVRRVESLQRTIQPARAEALPLLRSLEGGIK